MGGQPQAGLFFGEEVAMASATRQSLLDRVRDTNTGDSWDQFVRIYDGMILKWLRCQNVSTEDAEDVRQEVMAAVYQEIGNFQHNGRPGAFRNWLRRITSNRLHRLWRKRKSHGKGQTRELESLASQLADDRSHMTLIWDQQHDQYVLEKLLEELAERFQPQSIEIFRRVALQQESANAVASELGMSLGAIRVAQHRVLRALKELGQGLLE